MTATCKGITYEVKTKRCDSVPRLVKFGKRGHTIVFAAKQEHGGTTKGREEGYDDPEDFFAPSKWWAHDHMEQRDVTQFEGVAWVDMRAAIETDAGFHMAVSGPMVDVDLPDGAIEHCPEPSPILAFGLAHAGNEFSTLTAMQVVSRAKKERIGPLDSVSIPEFLTMWKAAGAKVGVIKAGQFIEQ